MGLRRVLSLCCCIALLASVLCAAVPRAAAANNFTRVVTVSAPNTAHGSINPLFCLDASQPPFHTGGPFFVSGYYRFHMVAGMPKNTDYAPAASVFGNSVSDTAGAWVPFSASFSTADSLNFQGMLLWYMAGELSMAGVQIRNAAGEVVYDMETDPALTPTATTALVRKGLWYLWSFGNYDDFLFTISAPEPPVGLVEGSKYTLTDTVLSGVPYGTDVLTVRSNFNCSHRITAWRGSSKLSDTATVTPDTTFIYNNGQSDAVTFTLASMTGDYNGDGRVDIRDLRIAKEASFGDIAPENPLSVDINGDLTVDSSDADLLRGAITGQILYAKQSIGADGLLQLASPVGRLHKDNGRLLMEHSAANFTLTGRLQGDVTADIWTELTGSLSDPIGLFVEVDGKVRFVSVSTHSQYATVTLAENLPAGKHTIRVYKASDAANNVISVSAVQYMGQLTKTTAANRRIEFLGDSITAGADVFPLGSAQRNLYGALTSYYSYAKKTADLLGAAHYSVANSGWRLCYSQNPQYAIRSIYPYQSMRSAYEGGEYAFDWNPQAVVINLGTNDRFTADESAFKQDVQELLALVRQKNPSAAIFWAYGAMDTGHASFQWIRDAVNAFAATDANTYFVSLPQNNNGANGHPDEAGQQTNAQILADAIQGVLGW